MQSVLLKVGYNCSKLFPAVMNVCEAKPVQSLMFFYQEYLLLPGLIFPQYFRLEGCTTLLDKYAKDIQFITLLCVFTKRSSIFSGVIHFLMIPSKCFYLILFQGRWIFERLLVCTRWLVSDFY